MNEVSQIIMSLTLGTVAIMITAAALYMIVAGEKAIGATYMVAPPPPPKLRAVVHARKSLGVPEKRREPVEIIVEAE